MESGERSSRIRIQPLPGGEIVMIVNDLAVTIPGRSLAATPRENPRPPIVIYLQSAGETLDELDMPGSEAGFSESEQTELVDHLDRHPEVDAINVAVEFQGEISLESLSGVIGEAHSRELPIEIRLSG